MGSAVLMRADYSAAELRRLSESSRADLLAGNLRGETAGAKATRVVEINGLRVGLIAGGLPIEVEKVMNPPPPGQRVDVVTIDQPDGEPTTTFRRG